MHTSFTPRGDWFVFDDAGATLAKGFRARAHAENWIARREKTDAAVG